MAGPDAGTPRDASLTAGVRGSDNRTTTKRGLNDKATANRGLDTKRSKQHSESISNQATRTQKRGLWLYRSDIKIGEYKEDSKDWKAKNILISATETKSGFSWIIEAVKGYYAEDQKKIPKLAIIVHGSLYGILYIENSKKNVPLSQKNKDSFKYLSPNTICFFENDIRELGKYLTQDAEVIFYSCLAGGGNQGTYLLSKISEYLPKQTIIGFTTKGETGGHFLQNKNPGAVYERTDSTTKPMIPRTVKSESAKHAKNGVITKGATMPPGEKTLPRNWKPTFSEDINVTRADLVSKDRYLYTLCLLVYGWAEKYNVDFKSPSFRDGISLIEEDQKFKDIKNSFIKGKDKGKKVGCVDVDYRVEISDKLNDKQKREYNELEKTLVSPQCRLALSFIWQNDEPNIRNRKTVEPYIEAMLLIRSRKKENIKRAKKILRRMRKEKRDCFTYK